MTTSIYSSDERKQIANVMLSQLGGRKFLVMTGCKDLFYYERDNMVVLRMSVGRNCKGINRFEIAYNEGRDLYELRFIRTRKNVDKIVSEHKGVYSDMLSDMFEGETGMVTSFMV